MNKNLKFKMYLVTVAAVVLAATLICIILDSPEFNNIQPNSAATSASTAVTESVSREKAININTAGVSELEELYRIGEKKAQAIIEYREKNGKFRSIEELTNVNGISQSILEENREKISVE